VFSKCAGEFTESKKMGYWYIFGCEEINEGYFG
jgi:hypothetical protein